MERIELGGEDMLQDTIRFSAQLEIGAKAPMQCIEKTRTKEALRPMADRSVFSAGQLPVCD